MKLNQAEFNTIFESLNIAEQVESNYAHTRKVSRNTELKLLKKIEAARKKLQQIRNAQSLKHRVATSNKGRSK